MGNPSLGDAELRGALSVIENGDSSVNQAAADCPYGGLRAVWKSEF